MGRMMKSIRTAGIAALLVVVASWALPGAALAADVFRVAVCEGKSDVAKKYAPLKSYLREKGIVLELVSTVDNPESGRLFARGEVNGMFAGSGLAGSLILKGLAYPALRPVSKDGRSTYWAAVVGSKGAPHYTGTADYFAGKTVTMAELASSGEVYFRSLPGIDKVGTEIVCAPSHQAAIEALVRKEADYAVVKIWTWESLQEKYPQLQLIGEDAGENPEGTLVIARKTKKELADKMVAALFGLNRDYGERAQAVRDSLGIRFFTKTNVHDFDHTLHLLRQAGVDRDFNFKFCTAAEGEGGRRCSP